jgi:hypothetical protein
MKAKTPIGGDNAAEHLYVVYEDVREALPYYIRCNYSEIQLLRQRYNSEFFLPYHRARAHHVPHFWVVADLIRWFSKFPVPVGDHDAFARELRARATTTPPTKPLRPSGAGKHQRARKELAE